MYIPNAKEAVNCNCIEPGLHPKLFELGLKVGLETNYKDVESNRHDS